MTRRPMIAGNWKLHNTVSDSIALANALRAHGTNMRCEIVVAPVFTALSSVREALRGSGIALSAQDVYWESKGAFTGQVSAPLLKDVGCTYCLVGHSERRQLFGETDDGVRKKVRALLAAGVTPIVCMGETLEQREQGATLGVVLGQLAAGLAGIDEAALSGLVIAYEPVWAICTGRTATPEDAQAVHAAIRHQLVADRGTEFAERVRILYGGSVKPDNAQALLSQPDVDGSLVGGASLAADHFMAIVTVADERAAS